MSKSPGIFVSFDGLKELKEKFKNLQTDAAKDVDSVLRTGADTIASKARQNLQGVVYNPDDYKKPLEKLYAKTNNITDLFQRGIGVNPVSFLSYEVVADMPYAAYVEFGTGGAVRIPQGVEDYAIQFKKPNRLNISMKANPYLFPAFFEQKPIIIQDIKDILTL
jgi:HK97 gp10 family phage protein